MNSKGCFDGVHSQSNRVLRHFLTVSVAGIDHNTPETKQLSEHSITSTESTSKENKLGLIANTIMVIVFWHKCGIIHIDYQQKQGTMSLKYDANLLNRFKEDSKKKHCNCLRRRECKSAHVPSRYDES